ncbi:MAG: apolipoprotein N-acyltransferase [Pseudomonadota bacterium]
MTLPVKSHGLTALGPLHESFARLAGWRAHGGAALLGAAGSLAFAPFHIMPLLVLACTGLIWMMDGARAYRRWGRAVFARGWAFGFGFFLVGMHWTAMPFLVEPERHAIFLFMPLILLPAGMGLIWGAGAALAGAFWSASPSRIFIFALFFALAEWTRGHLFGGFPWNLPGTTWAPGGAISQLASVGGVYWLTLLTLFAAAAPAAVVDTRETRGLGARLMPAFFAVAVFVVGWTWGAQRLAAQPTLTDETLLLMDAGVPQNEKFVDGVGTPLLLRRYLELMRDTPSQPGDIVIWPEGALGSVLLRADTLESIAAFLGDRALIAGTARSQPRGGGEYDWYNSLAVLDAESAAAGIPRSIYDKHRLVPFGELPAAEIIPFGRAMSAILPGAIQQMARSGFVPGRGPATIYADGVVPPFVAMICYEALYPSIARSAQPRDGADWLLVISNDAWFGVGMGPAQHYAQNRYRSIETGTPMARVASRGASAVIDSWGREIARGEPAAGDPERWRSSVLRAPLPEPLQSTPYKRSGDLLFWLSLAIFSMLAFFMWRR